ncbi:MAG: site-specific DNA-methyltransferase [Verrucomicrobia bacterium]|nr:site-specific DNA-methyltransferase [Verrucomicrobiota bacterium]
MPARRKSSPPPAAPQAYSHPEASSPARPEIGAQAHFKKSKTPATYRYDSSLAPDLCWDEENPARVTGEWLLACLEAAAKLKAPHVFGEPRKLLAADGSVVATCDGLTDGVRQLRALGSPFLNWSGKAERPSFQVPTLPLFIHERLSTRAILATLAGHKRDKQDDFLTSLFGANERPLHEQVLKAYEYPDQWVNRMILGDSLVVMNSLLQFENLAGQVQMIYIDPPYGVKFGSNFQPFIRKRDVKHNEDEDFTREPEMVQAYRDTWELGLHSYLSYLRDRLRVARDLLADSGSVFVQSSDENLHHVREVMDEVFGADNSCGLIAFRTTGGQSHSLLATSTDFLLWFAKDKSRAKSQFSNPTIPKLGGKRDGSGQYTMIEPPDYSQPPRQMNHDELDGVEAIPEGWRILAHDTLYSQGAPSARSEGEFPWHGQTFRCPPNTHWKPGVKSGGMKQLADANRLMIVGNTLRYKRYVDDYPCYELDNVWNDTAISGFARKKEYVVETSAKVVERCLLMTTKPGDLVIDPTCGSGTTAYVAEQWGRRWITCDTSRVPLALARQRILTATFGYHELKDESRGPLGGFVYQRKQNKKGEEVGGIVPHITLKSIANNEPPQEAVLVDRPETVHGITRVSGPFVFEATIPTAEGLDEDQVTPGIQCEAYQIHVERMTEVLRRAPVLRLPGKQTITLKQIRPPAKTLTLSAEAIIEGSAGLQPASEAKHRHAAGATTEAVAILFGPDNGAISERMVREAWNEAGLKHYTRLFVIGFGIDPKAREFIDNAATIGIPAFYLQATMDLQMGDLLKNMRSSHVFSVCGLPDVAVRKATPGPNKAERWQVELLGLETFDPVTMDADSVTGKEVPAWFLDTDYNGMVFRVHQAFFPRTGAWEKLKKSLKVEFEDGVWGHLAGTTSAPFEPGDQRRIAVKVIDPRGNELLAVKKLEDTK